MSSIQRRYDRYKIFYVKKMLRDIVPNAGINICHNSMHRNGLKLEIISGNISKLRQATFQYIGPRIFNLLPKDIRNHSGSMDNFEKVYDDFLSMIPDVQWLDLGSKLHSNTFEHQLCNWKLRIHPYSVYLRVRAQLYSQ